ncbi:hypothetical protein SMACR_05581 [Sordaria macrospora]|uniref:DnaJ homolog subfamily C member 30, mitochondrial n=1 Tax=Sordaria macrospora TaxID=5147 RepID=A0A8S8ZB74_SORMA|nr:hypothetical protein SMACR_05581 [Sordaria macrospora]KAH7633880.1 hypothetical protein B0T09DRAFT_372344 [Sordaria sp. MPI-SDFR-AT-0083]WPJ59759.1 hypothetical protein SMAC4_05581 [Sordaria macrospora]
MPIHYSSFGAALRPLGRQCRRLPQLSAPPPSFTVRVNGANNVSRNFTTSNTLRTGRQEPEHYKNHYETLNVHFDATQAEIKKSFYHLSKAHHPDHNPSDPHSAHRFMRISEAYSILSHADKRLKYDRDVLRLHLRARAHGSHHSSSVGPAGGRPASGLSKRRSTTQGAPPPSFFRQGGYGESKAKREREKQRAAETGYPQGGFAGFAGFGSQTTNETGPGGRQERKEWTGQHFDPSTAPHFDSEQHTRTHEQLWENLKKSHARRQEQARQQQRDQQFYYQQHGEEEERAQTQGGGGKKVLPELQQGNWTSFFVVTAVLVVSSFGPYWLFGEWKSTGKGAAGGGGGGGGGGKSSGGNGSGGGSRKQAAAAA